MIFCDVFFTAVAADGGSMPSDPLTLFLLPGGRPGVRPVVPPLALEPPPPALALPRTGSPYNSSNTSCWSGPPSSSSSGSVKGSSSIPFWSCSSWLNLRCLLPDMRYWLIQIVAQNLECSYIAVSVGLYDLQAPATPPPDYLTTHGTNGLMGVIIFHGSWCNHFYLLLFSTLLLIEALWSV